MPTSICMGTVVGSRTPSGQMLERKPGALPGSSALAQARSGGGFTAAHERYWQRARLRLGDRGGTRALIEVLLLHRRLPFVAVHAALDALTRLGAVDPGHVPQGGVTAHHPYQFLAGSLQQHLLARRELTPRRGEQRHHRHVAPPHGPLVALLGEHRTDEPDDR